MRTYALVATLAFILPSVAAQTPQTAADFSAQIDLFQRDASKLTPGEIYEEIQRLRTVLSIKQRNGHSLLVIDADTAKATGYAQELKRRREANEPAASFHYAMYNIRICGGLQSANLSDVGNLLSDCWLESLNSFKVASNGGLGTASFNIGRMYERGWGVTSSKLVAADWYIKAANQHNSVGAREDALTALEAALSAVPDHPSALKLRAAMLR